MTQMVEMPKEMRNALLSSAYGKAYVNGGGMSASGQGVEIARINADQREKDRLLREKIASERAAFNREKMEFYVANNLNKEAKELLSGMSDEEKEYVKAKYKEKAMAWLGEEKKSKPAGDEFVELSREEFAKLSDEEKKAYKESWMAWKQGQAK